MFLRSVSVFTVFLSLGYFSQNTQAELFPDGEVQFVEKLIEYSKNVPENRKQVMQDLIHDLGMGRSDKLEKMIVSPSADLQKALIKGLLEGEDSENLMQLIEMLEKNDVQTLGFLSALREQVQSDPEKLARIQNSLNLIYSDLLVTPIRSPSFGIRSLQATMIFLAGASLQLALFPTLLDLYMSGDKYAFLIPQVLLMGVFATAAVAEVRVFFRTWRDYKNVLQRRWHSEKNIKFFRKIINGFKKAPHLLPALDRMRYFTSRDAVSTAKQVLTQYPSLLEQQLQDLKEEPGLFNHIKKFFYTHQFHRLMKKLNQSLSETEKQELIRVAESSGEESLPLSLQVEVLDFERQLQQEFEQWMQREGQSTFLEKYRRVLAKRGQSSEMTQDGGIPRNAYFITTTVISLGLGVMSLSDASVNQSIYGMAPFHDAVASFFRNFRSELYYGFAGLVGVSLGYQTFSTQKLWWNMRFRMNYSHEMSLENLNQLSNLLPRWDQIEKPELNCEKVLGNQEK